jgi:hypothetical protein
MSWKVFAILQNKEGSFACFAVLQNGPFRQNMFSKTAKNIIISRNSEKKAGLLEGTEGRRRERGHRGDKGHRGGEGPYRVDGCRGVEGRRRCRGS